MKVAAEFNRCLTFTTPKGPITVKVLGPDDTAKETRDFLLTLLGASGLEVLAPVAKTKK